MAQLLGQLQALLRPEDGLSAVDALAFHGLCVDARAGHTVADPVGKAFHELEKVAYGLGVKSGKDWLLPADLVEALVARGREEQLEPPARAALEAWER